MQAFSIARTASQTSQHKLATVAEKEDWGFTLNQCKFICRADQKFNVKISEFYQNLNFLPNATMNVMWKARFIWKICQHLRKCHKRNICWCLIIFIMQKKGSFQFQSFRVETPGFVKQKGSTKMDGILEKNFHSRKSKHSVTLELTA